MSHFQLNHKITIKLISSNYVLNSLLNVTNRNYQMEPTFSLYNIIFNMLSWVNINKYYVQREVKGGAREVKGMLEASAT